MQQMTGNNPRGPQHRFNNLRDGSTTKFEVATEKNEADPRVIAREQVSGGQAMPPFEFQTRICNKTRLTASWQVLRVAVRQTRFLCTLFSHLACVKISEFSIIPLCRERQSGSEAFLWIRSCLVTTTASEKRSLEAEVGRRPRVCRVTLCTVGICNNGYTLPINKCKG